MTNTYCGNIMQFLTFCVFYLSAPAPLEGWIAESLCYISWYACANSVILDCS